MTTLDSPGTTAARVEVRGEGVTKAFGDHVVLQNIDLEIRQGEIVAMVGTSGCGKTVLMHMLLGLLPPTEGRVLVADHEKPDAPLIDIVTAPLDEIYQVRLSWAVVFQHNALFSASVYENCALWLREHTEMDEDAIRERVRESLAAVKLNVDTVMAKHRAELSGGMAKRVAIARALAVDPMVVWYDEPTTGLDPVTATHIHDLLWHTHHSPHHDGARRTTVVITHDRDLLRRIHPRVILLHGGGIAFDGPYEEFTQVKDGPVHEYLAEMPALHARPNRYGQ